MGTREETTNSAVASGKNRKTRFDFLDGLRGLAALLIVVHHVWQHSLDHSGSGHPPAWFNCMGWLVYGHYAVAVFIALSGYCLMLPVARQSDRVLPGGAWSFLKKRSRRILPPYFAALLLSLAALSAIPGLRAPTGLPPVCDVYSGPAMMGAILSHVFMVHNLNVDWIFRINGPLWSVATEYQIYFLFPVLLLPAWRRFGLLAPVAVGFLLGVATIPIHLGMACFWYLGLFAAGMAAAVRSIPDRQGRLPRAGGCLGLAIIFAGLAAGFYMLMGPRAEAWQPVTDLLVGAAVACLLAYGAVSVQSGAAPSPLLRILSAPPATRLGHFSYSLYLTHFPLILAIQAFLLPYHLPSAQDFLLLSAMAIPLSLGFAYLFHVLFERPFMKPAPQRVRVMVNGFPIPGLPVVAPSQ